MANYFIGEVCGYVSAIMEGRYYCPFSSFEEAAKAYRLHRERESNRRYTTLDEQWQKKYRTALMKKGYIAKKLRPRRGMHCLSDELIIKRHE